MNLTPPPIISPPRRLTNKQRSPGRRHLTCAAHYDHEKTSSSLHILQPQHGDLIRAGAAAGCGGGALDDGLALSGEALLVGRVGGFAAVGGVVGPVVGHGARGGRIADTPACTAVGDSFFLACRAAHSNGNYRNRVVPRDSTIAIASPLIGKPASSNENYHNRMYSRAHRGVGRYKGICTRAHRMVTAHNSLGARA